MLCKSLCMTLQKVPQTPFTQEGLCHLKRTGVQQSVDAIRAEKHSRHPYSHRISLKIALIHVLSSLSLMRARNAMDSSHFISSISVNHRECQDLWEGRRHMGEIWSNTSAAPFYSKTMQQTNRNTPQLPLKPIQVHQSPGVNQSNGSSLPVVNISAREPHGNQGMMQPWQGDTRSSPRFRSYSHCSDRTPEPACDCCSVSG